ncbi:MAG: orotate phosphoribosyltransferase [Candidatus Omnitrophota bacterium]|nr:orotate phosphoribosyltransferase [Candidatus Omnitrophota bacterium]
MMKEELNSLKKELFKELKSNAFFREKITLSSGKRANYYIDCRMVTLSSKGSYLSAKIILAMIKQENIAAVGGPTLGADPLVGAIATLGYLNKAPINTFIVRKAPKLHGKMRRIEGPQIKKGSRVIVIDDVATTGKSILEAVEVLRQDGIKVDKAIVIVDRQEGAAHNLTKKNCSLISIFKASEFLK